MRSVKSIRRSAVCTPSKEMIAFGLMGDQTISAARLLGAAQKIAVLHCREIAQDLELIQQTLFQIEKRISSRNPRVGNAS